jgi:hypothetical protein
MNKAYGEPWALVTLLFNQSFTVNNERQKTIVAKINICSTFIRLH